MDQSSPASARHAGSVDDLIFDVGLHKGEDTDFYLAKGYRVVSFEANPDLAQACRDRFRHAIAAGRLTIVEGAIAPESAGDELTFYVSSKSVWGTTDAEWVARNELAGVSTRQITARRVDISETFRRFGVPHYLKIDIEGADRHVLEVLGTFPARPPFISIESEKADFDALIEELTILRDLGYRRFKAVQQEFIPGSRLTTSTLKGEPLNFTFPDDASGPFGDDLAGPWLDFDGVVADYEKIFRRYRMFGDASAINRIPGAARLLWYTGKALGRGLPGWYDTHARLD